MQEYVHCLPDALTGVAYGVLRQRDAEDVAQEALIKAHSNFRRLRDRTRFRAWLVRLTWRLAKDRQRTNRPHAPVAARHNQVASVPCPSELPHGRKDGRTGQLTTAADPITGETMRVDVTLTVVK